VSLPLVFKSAPFEPTAFLLADERVKYGGTKRHISQVLDCSSVYFRRSSYDPDHLSNTPEPRVENALGISGSSGSVQRLDSLKPGDKIPGFSAINASGIETKVSYDEAAYLIFITSTKCPWCEKTLPSWKEISDKAKGKSIRIVSIAIDGNADIKAYVRDHGLNFEVVNFPNASLQSTYKAFSTPQTVLVRQGGQVEKLWSGMLSDTAKNEILDLLSQTHSVSRKSSELLETQGPPICNRYLITGMEGGIPCSLVRAS
jgi:peroxiredoxin